MEKSQDCRLQTKTTEKSSSKIPHSSSPEQQNSAIPNQEQQKFTKLRAADNTSRWDGQATNFRPPGRGDNRFYPSKNFAPFNGSPAPRHFLLDQGLTILITVANGEEGGRGGWVTTGVGSKEGRSVGFSRKKPAKKGTMGDSKAVEK